MLALLALERAFRSHRRLGLAFALAAATTAAPASAQSLGTFHWQLAPYCNVVTVQVTQVGSTYTLDGYDTQCGGSTRAPATGMAVLNPSGTVELGLAIVTSPAATPVHVSSTIDLASLGGNWRDSLGHSGTLVFTPSGVGTGSPRPSPLAVLPVGSVTTATIADGTVGAVDINAAEVQRRVSSSCPSDELMAAVNVDGTVACRAVTASSGGDITGVMAGNGLTGGGPTGNVSLSVNFAGDGAGSTVAFANHEHMPASGFDDVGLGRGALGQNQTGGDNVAVGDSAMAANVTGIRNVAVGSGALAANVDGDFSTAVGYGALANAITSSGSNAGVGNQALGNLVDGHSNAAFGSSTLLANISGDENLGVGSFALRDTTGSNNTAAGYGALRTLTTGDGNIGVGHAAGSALTAGSNNIYLGSLGASAESATIRIGRSLQTRAYIAGVNGVTTGGASTAAVVIDNNGQLGTISSTRRMKEDIRDLEGVGPRLHQLRPVQFRYVAPFSDGSKPVQYGLIAEEVADVLPELVAYGSDGQPATVMYHVLPSLLLAEVQRLERERLRLLDRLERDRDALTTRIEHLETALQSVRHRDR